MSYQLHLEIPDELYQKLLARAERENKTVEQVAVEILEAFYEKTIGEDKNA